MKRDWLLIFLCVLTLSCLTTIAQTQPSPQARPIHTQHNPILSDGSYYSADPAPIVVGDTLYILAGRDEAPPDENDFIMNEWQLFATRDVASGDWLHYPATLKPEQVFAWAAPGRAYAGQIVRALDGRFYLYAPVAQAKTESEDPFGVGVAVADSPLGPWKDAHPVGPIASQSVPEPNRIQNIDPTVMIDDDDRVYMYWGTFGQLRGVELKSDMVTPVGPVVTVRSLTGFFEAPWLFKRNKTYYLVYADNQAGPDSPCTPAIYHACIGYGTADSPLGPWTYRGVILPIVSSTTSHPGIINFKGQWYIVYHTADANGGGHFRRSVAIDKLEWDDSTTPPSMKTVKPTRAPIPPRPPSRNIAPAALATASNDPLPVQYWIKAVNDELVPANPLPPQTWSTWRKKNIPAHAWLQYEWKAPVRINGSRIAFWNDQPAGANEGVAPPAAWHLEYWNGKRWSPVPHASVYKPDYVETSFSPVTTRCLRAVFDASGHDGKFAGVAVREWEVFAPKPIPMPESYRSENRNATRSGCSVK